MKDNITDCAYVSIVGIFSLLGIATLNDVLSTISICCAILVGVGRIALIAREWRRKQ